MAIEDAAVLGHLFSHLSHSSQITPLLRAYETLRHARTAATQASSRLNQHIFHLPDGPDQEARDASMRAAYRAERRRWGLPVPPPEGKGGATSLKNDEESFKADGNSNQWADQKKNVAQFGYDADRAVEEWWREKGEKMCRRLEEAAKEEPREYQQKHRARL